MRLFLALTLVALSSQSAMADQFIAMFNSPNHPRSLPITITQLDAAGNTLDTDNRSLRRTGPTRSTWAVILRSNVSRVCVTLRGTERATSATTMLGGGATSAPQISSGGAQICPTDAPGNIDMLMINFE